MAIEITDLALPLDGLREEQLEEKLVEALRKRLGMQAGSPLAYRVLRRSVDARRRHGLRFIYSLLVDLPYQEQHRKLPGVRKSSQPFKQPSLWTMPARREGKRPVVCGSGPAGLFAAYRLCEAGLPPILIEQGRALEGRIAQVEAFQAGGPLDPWTNIQFGEGGAGTFSDGKLNSRSKSALLQKVLDIFVSCGAPETVSYVHNPHIGTDLLRVVLRQLREKLVAAGCEFRFETRLTGLHSEAWRGRRRLCGLQTSQGYMETEALILATGHSARQVYALLDKEGIAMAPKAFAVGLRIEHPQTLIDQRQYGRHAGHPLLGAAEYRLAVQQRREGRSRGVYSFCMCPGGEVVAAASEAKRLVVNGMSEHARAQRNANAAILVQVGPEDYGPALMAGLDFQAALEGQAYRLGGGAYAAPVMRVKDYLAAFALKAPKGEAFGRTFEPSYRPKVRETDLSRLLPEPLGQALAAGLLQMEAKIPGFASAEAWLTGVESRSSAPLRILREKDGQSPSLAGLYPTGEGAAYAGGISSSAVDGMRQAEALLRRRLAGPVLSESFLSI